jgi:ketosteroid isomerase-like protein
MSVEENKALIRRVWDELNKGNLEILDECFDDNFVRIAYDGKKMDKQGYRNMSAFILKNSPDTQIILDDMVGEGDKVAFRMTITGSSNGKPFTAKETYFASLDSGKIVEYVNLNRMLD